MPNDNQKNQFEYEDLPEASPDVYSKQEEATEGFLEKRTAQQIEQNQPNPVNYKQFATTSQVLSGDDSQSQPAVDDAAGSDVSAEDVDLIEKEWVDQIKDVIDNTKDDPREQSQEINKLKAEYLQRRYNRKLKTED